ncbi:hypothetical protein [Micromonospora sp. NPDC047187]|uniref:hypothetical protein n=1 Tax=Micromonospora sp. NPDC047187 TaxID=3155262 RepID=UPI0033D2355B
MRTRATASRRQQGGWEKSQAYQRAGSAAARKQVAERFLSTWADGWSPPMVAREELYARAQRLAKSAAR